MPTLHDPAVGNGVGGRWFVRRLIGHFSPVEAEVESWVFVRLWPEIVTKQKSRGEYGKEQGDSAHVIPEVEEVDGG